MPRKTPAPPNKMPAGWPCFNEAGAGMPRKTSGYFPLLLIIMLRFNEAGAGMPRKTLVIHMRHGSRQTRFNEAGAGMPRKTILFEKPWNISPVASMRPGLECPGRRSFGITSQECINSFNEAGAGMPRKTPHAGSSQGHDRAGFNEAGAGMPRKTRRKSHDRSNSR